jgi:uncharacterized protein YjlB
MQLIRGITLFLSLLLLFACGGSSNEPTVVAEDGASSDNPPSDDPQSSARGSAQTIAAEGGPVIDVPAGSMSTIGDFDANEAGQFVYVGSYQSGDQNKNAIWTGSIENQRLLLSTGDPIEGLENNAGYGSTYSFSLASDGSIAHISSLSGALEGSSALIISNNETQKIVIKTGDALGTEATLGSLKTSSASPYGAAFSGLEDNSVYETLWLYDNETVIEVARKYYSPTSSAPPVADNACEVEYTGHEYGLLDDGNLVFEATVSGSGGGCTFGTAIINYSKGQYHSIVSEGQTVPGTQESRFTNIRLIKVSDNVPLISADLETPTGTSIDSKHSYWSFPLSAEPRLIALEGETIQLGDKKITLSRQSLYNAHIDFDGNGNLALRLDLSSDIKNVSLFGGTGHGGQQPHPSISTPGASALQYVTSQTGALPAPFKTTDFFSTLNEPLLDSNGNLVFYGEITNHEQATITSSSIWQANLDGGFHERVKSRETINVGGEARTITSPGREDLKLTANNTLIFKASLEGYSRKALVYVDPTSQ